ncbi:C-type lectin domain family 4 member E-like [Labeo rohita]|uniref:C-type lectin domain family 4 member E-like n=1 Tax=Labeo rohita TaxID=84645 RepID=UPI0021E1EB20|nr:C-type lectin domain family 4 member E-like [Labeo rohita]
MYREHGKSTDDIYENDFVTKGKLGRQTMDSNMRIQPSKLTGRTPRMNKGARQTETEDIYENADAMKGKITMKTEDSYTKRIQPPEHTGRDCVKIINYRSAVVCLVLLCVLLLTAVIALGVTFTQERQQLIFKNKNLTNQRDQLRNNSQIHDGWICYQSTCYYISKEMKNWNESRQDCLNRGADLIIINNRQEQDFVTDMPGVAAVYIGLADTNLNGTWKWVDGTLTSGFSFWALKEPTGGIENCAVTVAVSQLKFGNSLGWHHVVCTTFFPWICEKRIPQLTLP